MTVLVPMRTEVYVPYLKAAIAGYAEDNVASGRWPRKGAIKRSHADFGKLLPQGLATPDNYLLEIKATDDGPTVGFIWFAIEERQGVRSAFIYDVAIHAEYRRQGHATRAFAALEPLVAAVGATSIGLHVFGHNQAAQTLYAKLGYEVTGINMAKPLGKRKA